MSKRKRIKFKGIFNLIFNRVFLISALMILQMAIILFYLVEMSSNYFYVEIITVILSLIVFIVLIHQQDLHPEQKILWTFLIMGVPIVGTVLYLVFSFNEPIKKRFKKYMDYDKNATKQSRKEKDQLYELAGEYKPQFIYLENMTSLNINKNTNVKFLKDGTEFYNSLIKDLKKAKKFIFMEYFIINHGTMWNEIHNILKEKVKEGVDVRLIYDDLGTCKHLKSNYYKTLQKEGIKCRVFNRMIPIISSYHNNRDHRKITIIDGVIGYTGGINLSDEYINLTNPYGHWQDNAIRLHGQGVDNLTILFMQFYSLTSKTFCDIEPFLYKNNKTEDIISDEIVFSFGTGPKIVYYESLAIDVFLNLIYSAKKSIDITTPYLLTDYTIKNALISACNKGVKVRILFPGKPDKKISWAFGKQNALELTKHGVEIYSYTPGFNHGKSFLVDDKIAYVGTTNLDYRSLLHHYECGTLIYNSESIKDIDAYFESHYLKAKLLKEEDLKVKPFLKIIITFLKVFESLF